MTTHAESINSDLQRGLDRRLRHTQVLNSFFPDATTSWNNVVISHFNDIPSFSVPKNHILSFVQRKKCILVYMIL